MPAEKSLFDIEFQLKEQVHLETQNADRLIFELEQVGIRYLSRGKVDPDLAPLSAVSLLSGLAQQTESRVYTALIAVFLLYPEIFCLAKRVSQRLQGESRQVFQILYTAAVILQRKYKSKIGRYSSGTKPLLPDYFSDEFIPAELVTTDEQLAALGQAHQFLTGKHSNWPGTYDNVARHLLRQLQLEEKWSQ